MDNIITFKVGAKNSISGHGKYAPFTIKSNLTLDDIKVAYKKGTFIVGLDVTQLVDSIFITAKVASKLLQLGFYLQEIEDDYQISVNGVFIEDPEDFFRLYLFTVSQGHPDFNYEDQAEINAEYIGGYHCFLE